MIRVVPSKQTPNSTRTKVAAAAHATFLILYLSNRITAIYLEHNKYVLGTYKAFDNYRCVS